MTGGADAYRAAGVDYGVLDAAKRHSMAAVRESMEAPLFGGAQLVHATVGEPAQLLELDGAHIATVLECLGTKSEIAHEVEDELGLDLWEAIGIDTVATVVNDLSCVGAVPLTVSAYVATGGSSWYRGSRHASFVEGFRKACTSCGAAWIGGESPALPGIVADGSVDLAASGVGRLPRSALPWLSDALVAGDEIVLVSSSGLHANGASLARAVARRLPRRWATPLEDATLLGEAALRATLLYPPLVRALHSAGLGAAVHYATNITGHGLRKLMRGERDFTYRVERLQPVPPVLALLASEAGLTPAEAYATFNMGSGFSFFARRGAGEEIVALAAETGYQAVVAGRLEEGERSVVLEPIGVSYESSELDLR